MISFQQRDCIWDYLRAFVLFILLLDHAFHAYALHFNRWHFLADKGASWVDYVYLHNNNIIVPLLFFIIGLFVIPSFKTKGASSFFKGRLMRLGIPWLIGIPLIVPFLCYPRYLQVYPQLNIVDFLFKVYFPDSMQGGGPFWILWYLLFLTGLAIVLYKWTPLIALGQRCLEAWDRNVIIGTILFTALVIVLFVLSDIFYGPYHWVGVVNFLETPSMYTEASWLYHGLKLFKVQGSRFLIQGLFFLTGVIVGASPLLKNYSLWSRFAACWKLWAALYLGSFIAYVWYIGIGLEGSFDTLFTTRFPTLMREGYEGPSVSQAFYEHLYTAGPRLALQGIALVMTSMAWISFFHRFMTRQNQALCRYAQHSYGIFLLHEVPVIWMQYFLTGYDIPILLKVILILFVGGGATFLAVKGLKKLPGVNKVL